MRAALVAFALGLALAAPAASLDDPAALDARVGISDVRVADGAIEAILTNRSAREIRDVRLLVEYLYAWPDEMHPGDDSPSRAWPHVVSDPIPPGASIRLRFEPPDGLPTAPTGTFTPRLRVLGLTERGEAAPLAD